MGSSGLFDAGSQQLVWEGRGWDMMCMVVNLSSHHVGKMAADHRLVGSGM